MNYLIPFSILKNSVRLVSTKGQLKVDMSYDEFLGAIRKLLQAVPVDEQWYRATYNDVDEAIRSGTYKSAKQHFLDNGYFEGRRPAPLAVDEEWYLASYPDVRDSIADGAFTSGQDHFVQYGYDEGRLPSAD